MHHFNPRPPWGGRPEAAQTADKYLHISIHALRGEGDPKSSKAKTKESISIHALRGEGDLDELTQMRAIVISIHALRGEGDIMPKTIIMALMTFQSTPSVGRATMLTTTFKEIQGNFNPRPPWGGRLCSPRPLKKFRVISIHALRGEGDYAHHDL